ncbi:Ser/Thr protein phosphatase family protein [Clostridiaceae bacterium JG1575]|nr:Ser/Thr protein phosphatase family protein [Clostridiaceae bacterium JG1575]
MALYALSDLHLSFTDDKPMGIFGPIWENHDQKIHEHWMAKIKDTDTVLLGGDLSWSMTQEEAYRELDYIASLPGRKIAIKGNHDYWWTSITTLNRRYDNFDFIQNNFFLWERTAICGTRGWVSEGSDKFTKEDEKIYRREGLRLENSLKAARGAGYQDIIAMIHYPPTNERGEDSVFTTLLEAYGVRKVIYGHLHGNALKNVFQGMRNGVEYLMTSGDFLHFDPLLIEESSL